MSTTVKVILVFTFILFSFLTMLTFIGYVRFAKVYIIAQAKANRYKRSAYVTPFLNQKQSKKYQFNNVKDSIAYEKIMIEYYSLQSMATNIFPVDTTLAGKEKSLSDIKDIGIYYWDRDLEILDSLETLDLPTPLVAKTRLFKDYCKTNKQCYELMYKAVNERTKKYDPRINAYFKEIAEKRKLIASY